MRQNAGPILALAGFKRVISVFKYQEFMPDPSDRMLHSEIRFIEAGFFIVSGSRG
jgi:hypothetical protein